MVRPFGRDEMRTRPGPTCQREKSRAGRAGRDDAVRIVRAGIRPERQPSARPDAAPSTGRRDADCRRTIARKTRRDGRSGAGPRLLAAIARIRLVSSPIVARSRPRPSRYPSLRTVRTVTRIVPRPVRESPVRPIDTISAIGPGNRSSARGIRPARKRESSHGWTSFESLQNSVTARRATRRAGRAVARRTVGRPGRAGIRRAVPGRVRPARQQKSNRATRPGRTRRRAG